MLCPGIYSLSLHDALAIYHTAQNLVCPAAEREPRALVQAGTEQGVDLAGFTGVVTESLGDHVDDVAFGGGPQERSEEHTSELQSRGHIVCRLLLEKKRSIE